VAEESYLRHVRAFVEGGLADYALLLVMNHGDMDYRRDATMKNPHRFTAGRVMARGTWEGWQPGDGLQFAQTGDALKWSFSLPPKSFILFEFMQAPR
jgi:hypothetical protein